MLEKKKILVVEDNPMNRMLLTGILRAEYNVLEAENGQEALDVLKDQGEALSLILLDIIMPVMDGYTFLSIIKADPLYASIPVIVTTQSDGEADEVSALSHGATDFVAKPYKPQVILHRVASIINLRETAAIINLVQHDRLTGLYSKEFFYQKANEILQKNPDKHYDVICSDIENFKLINDVFGMPAGDNLLRGIASMFAERVGDRGICGHINADQFACMLEHGPEYTDEMFIEASAQVNAFSVAKNVVMKWGVYTITDRTLSAEKICDRALLAARSIKGQYGKHFARYDDTLRSKLLREQAIMDSMETALREGQFEIYLQPKYSLQNDSLAGAEALVRWRHPEWGFQSPADFIPLFERNGFITKLDEYVWDKTCSVLQEWDAQGLAPISVSVNVSRADIYNADLEHILLEIVHKHGLAPSRLHLEITESAYTENPRQIIDMVSRLRNRGFVIEMDDFGSGYSSLNMLNEMPIDVLKLDMKFIQNETAKPVNQGILQFIIGLARWMNLKVVAEGVETREQVERLREIGCDYVQGYYFAKPMPCGEFRALLARQPEAAKTETVRFAAKAPRQVLLVADESAACREAARRAFEDKFDVVEVTTGGAALDYVLHNADTIAAVLLSLTLQDPDGFEVLRAMQSEREVWSIPIVATAPQNAGLEERALEMGADDFAAKPHTEKSLRRRVLRILGLHLLRERERILQEAAYQDALTGLLNRRGLNAALEALRKADEPLAVYLFDLDDLKRINDARGHLRGDQQLLRFAAILRANSRGNDILARLGGDEFVAIMKQMWPEENALKKGEVICAAARQDVGKEGGLSCSAGAAMWDRNTPFSEVLERADRALYRAKADKKGGCCIWKK